ncbi:carbohydrate-binding protein [Streptomyces silvensis]|uniref:Carbohydrate-binding protein n=1 Tax=Streptomyces silvensis TaxID=1765722 RepID=A0A0W7XAL5_9ACTN|nr:carbohydrate-binding protein [Streptomyces silvensis]KUF19792.1 carbohydrate-binding protein [Streptomyces silvensis]
MTPGNNGEHTPRAPEGDDDPFGYLYADGQAAGATPPSGGGGYGYPGPRSYNHVRAVGERQYGQAQQYGQQPQQYGQQTQGHGQAPAYGYPPVQQAPQQAYGQPNAHYAAPEAQPGATAPVRQVGGPGAPGIPGQAGNGGGRGRGPNTKGLLIGAIAVVAVVSIGIGAAMVFGGGGGDDDGNEAGPSQKQSVSEEPSPTESEDGGKKPPAELPEADAKALKLEGGTTTASDIKGAKSAGGVYVAGLEKPGAQVSWTVDGIPKSGAYTVFVGYSVPGKAAETTLGINGTPSGRKLNMDNFTGADEGAWEKGWTKTFAFVQLNKGTNTISVSCQQGDKCDAVLDRVWLKAGHVKE